MKPLGMKWDCKAFFDIFSKSRCTANVSHDSIWVSGIALWLEPQRPDRRALKQQHLDSMKPTKPMRYNFFQTSWRSQTVISPRCFEIKPLPIPCWSGDQSNGPTLPFFDSLRIHRFDRQKSAAHTLGYPRTLPIFWLGKPKTCLI